MIVAALDAVQNPAYRLVCGLFHSEFASRAEACD